MADEVKTQEEQRSSKLIELRTTLEELGSEMRSLDEKGVLDEAEQERWIDLNVKWDAIQPEYDKLEERAARIEQINKTTHRELRGMPEFVKPAGEYLGRDVTRMDWREARDGALRILNDREQNHVLDSGSGDRLERSVRSEMSTGLARRILVTENDDYRSAWMKRMTQPDPIYTAEEHAALLRFTEFRAMDEGATTHGGFAVPVFIDPTVILTDQETDNPFLRLAEVKDVNTNVWKGVSAAGVAWSFDSEASEVSDDAITVAQPSVTVNMARGFIPFSIEVGQDWPGFQSEMARLLAAGYDELLIDKFTRGSGSGEPRGLITALDANTNDEVIGTTDGAFGSEDLYKAWAALPQKYRRRASWMMSVGIMNKIRQFGSANNFQATTVQLPAGAIDILFSKGVYENPYFADFTGTTGAENRLVVGDFSNYVIARRAGMSVELVPHLLHTSNNRPMGQRGWFAYARIGGNSVNDLGFRLLQNQ